MKIYAISIVKLHVCCINIAAYLYQKINDEQRHQKVHHCWHSRRDDNNSENDPGEVLHKTLGNPRKRIFQTVHVFREPVHHSAYRCVLKETERRPHHARQCLLVNLFG